MNNKFYGTLLVFISLFIVLLFTKGEFNRFNELNTENENLTLKEQELKTEEQRLKKISEKLDKENGAYDAKFAKNLEKYSKDLKEDEILKFLYSKIEKMNGSGNVLSSSGNKQIIIKNLSISKSQENLMTMLESNINLALKVPNISKLKEVLNMLNSNDDYKFFISSLTYDETKNSETEDEGFEVSIPLKIFYK